MSTHITRKKTKTPWPTKAVMEQVYAMKLWGDNSAEFYSGDGSHNPNIVNPYISVVSEFLKSFKTPLSVCDLGCGDFNVGKTLVKLTKKYVAIDIVEDLITHNKNNFNQTHLEFQCLDIATAPLPTADCVFLRQVLQHLSNTEIQRILEKLKDFKYIILTEHIPEGDFIPNIDIISGQGIRLKKQSGVNILAAPFNFKIKEEQELLAINLGSNKGVILTTLYTNFT
ncbi:class I SAM-dependent methyltransferase [Formosa haliotis]|uniref:class I SAM-dependent methyltransferase n=1 Tax=Formosa haliotis TaxID=1555194 RepID=UPI000826B7C4|nr:class I SAM-dependent methyltransferase [Formosa haliotis]